MIVLHSNNIDTLDMNMFEKPVITVDFDDTLYDSMNAFPSRLEIFKIMIKNITTFIVTSRTSRINEIKDFCEKFDINIRGIIFAADDKYEVVSKINSSLHFDDDVNTIRKCIDANVPSLLMGEFLNKSFMNRWLKAKEDVIHYYMKAKGLETYDDLISYKFLVE